MLNAASSDNFFRRPISAWLIAFGGTAIGIWLEMASGRIRNTTLDFLIKVWGENPSANGVAWDAIGFWAACIAWATMVYFRLRKDDDVSESRIRELIRAITRAPDASVVINYPTEYFQPCIRALGPFLITSAPPDQAKRLVAGKIVEALKCIARMARHFARQPDAIYGANIMLAASPAQFSLIQATMDLRFHDSRYLDPLAAILYSREALCVASCDENRTRVVPAIAVPVPEALMKHDRYLAIPGAPRALLSGRPGVHIDAWKLHEDCVDLAAPIRDEIRHYFSASGGGKDIRSFASFRLGTEGDSPIGILNIDSNHTGILGTEPDYYPTFHALIEPIMAALALNVEEYARLDFASLEERAGASIPSGVKARAGPLKDYGMAGESATQISSPED
jgi:hypothetical protein